MEKQHLVLAGAGHAHMVTMAGIGEIRRLGHEVTVIGPSDYHYYSGMGPGMLGRNYQPDDIRFAVKRSVEEQGGTFVLDSVAGIDPDRRELRLVSGRSVHYDVLSFNTGSHIASPEIAGSSDQVFLVKPIEGLYRARTAIEAASQKQGVTVAVVGGGPAGVEVAGNLAHLLEGAKFPSKVILFVGSGLLKKFPDAVRNTSRKILMDKGVIIRKEGHLQSITDNCLQFAAGTALKVDFTILATGVHPSPFFREGGLQVGPDGGLLVNRYLQCPAHPEIFGGGDCICFANQPLDKVGVYAVRENPVLFHNLKAFLQGKPLQAFDPGGDYLLIFNLGNGQGVLRKNWFQISGRIAFLVKDWIDKRFIAKFK